MTCPRRRQTGAISAIAAFTLGLALTLAALSVDLGHLFWAKRDLQKAVDLASLSAVTDLSAATTTAQQIATANGFDPNASGHTLGVTTGIYDEDKRTFSAGGAADAQNAVQVTATESVAYFFLPGAYTVQATAMATREPIAGFSLGSFLARINTTDPNLLNGTLGGLLGGHLNLTLAGYEGLAAANVSLLGLSAGLGLGTVNKLLAANVTLGQLLDGAISALNAQGNSSAALTLGMLKAAVSATLPPIAVGDLLKVEAGNPESAADAQVNVLQLITLAAQIANVNSGNLIKVPSLGVTIPPILGIVGATTSLAMTMIEKPSIAIGPAKQDSSGNWVTRAHSGQLRVRLNVALTVNLAGLVGLNVNLPIYIEGGSADAALTGIQCKVPKEDSVVTIQTQPQLLAAYIGTVSDGAMSNRSSPVTVAPATIATVKVLVLEIPVTAQASVNLQNPGQTLNFNGPFDYNNTQTVAGSGLGLGGLLNSHLTLSASGDSLLSLISGLLGSVLDGLILNPLLSLLGIELGGGDVTAFYLNCGTARLVQ